MSESEVTDLKKKVTLLETKVIELTQQMEELQSLCRKLSIDFDDRMKEKRQGFHSDSHKFGLMKERSW